jgi:hypothetical protein
MSIVIRRSWHFSDGGPLTLICPQLPKDQTSSLSDRGNPNYTNLAGFGDLDALMELHGHIRAENPSMDVFLKVASHVNADDLSGHIVVIGGIGWNDITRRLNEMISLPVKQVEDARIRTGEIFVVGDDSNKVEFLPSWQGDDPGTVVNPGVLVNDVGLLVRIPNPLNSNRTLTMCNGIHSRGVLGAVRSLTDARLRESNERYIARAFPREGKFGILMRVLVIEGETMTPDFSTSGTVLYQWPVKA